MELALTVGALYTAYNLSKKVPGTREKRNSVPEKQKFSGENIYDSDRSNYARDYAHKQAEKSFNAARKHEENKIPPYMNQIDYHYDDPREMPINSNILPERVGDPTTTNYEPTGMNAEEFNNKLFSKKPQKGSEYNQDLSKFDDREKFVSPLSGKVVRKKHNNMVPFFSGNETPENHSNSGAKDAILERFTGVNKDTKIKRKEIGNIQDVKPQDNVLNSKQFTTEVDRDRAKRSVSETRNNVVPTASYSVKPLPQEVVRPQPKNVDQLRAKSNPKVSYKGRMVKGIRPSETVRAEIGRYEQQTPNNTRDEAVMLPGSPKVGAQKAKENFDNLDCTTRSQKQHNMGVPKSRVDKTHFDYVRQNYNYLNEEEPAVTISSQSNKETYLNDPFRNAKAKYNLINEQERHSFRVKEQERSTTNYGNHLLAAKDTSQGNYLKYTDKPKTTDKEMLLYSYTSNPEVNVKSSPNRKQYKNFIPAKKDKISDRKGYMAGPMNQHNTVGTESVNLTAYKNTDSFDETYNTTKPDIAHPRFNHDLGEQMVSKNKTKTETDFGNRIDDKFVSPQLKNNPYALKRNFN